MTKKIDKHYEMIINQEWLDKEINQAKKEVFDDIENMVGFETYHKDKWVAHIKDYLKLKKKHLK